MLSARQLLAAPVCRDKVLGLRLESAYRRSVKSQLIGERHSLTLTEWNRNPVGTMLYASRGFDVPTLQLGYRGFWVGQYAKKTLSGVEPGTLPAIGVGKRDPASGTGRTTGRCRVQQHWI